MNGIGGGMPDGGMGGGGIDGAGVAAAGGGAMEWSAGGMGLGIDGTMTDNSPTAYIVTAIFIQLETATPNRTQHEGLQIYH